MSRLLRALAVAGSLALCLVGIAHAQTLDRLMLSGGADAAAFSSADVGTFIPDRVLAEHVQDPLMRLSDAGQISTWLATGREEIDPLVLELTLPQGAQFLSRDGYWRTSFRASWMWKAQATDMRTAGLSAEK